MTALGAAAYDEDKEFVERTALRLDCYDRLLLDEAILDRVRLLGFGGVVFALHGKVAYASVGGVAGVGRTPTSALADALSKIYVPEVQA